MGPLLASIALFGLTKPAQTNPGQGETPEFLAKRSIANTKFRKLVSGAKTISVEMTIKQNGNPVPGQAVLILERPDRLYYHISWGPDTYTYTILDGHATEVDLANKVYDEYDVPHWTAPEANGSDWMSSFFPSVFVNESLLLPPNCFDDAGHVVHYAIGSSDDGQLKKNVISFENYKFNQTVPLSRFRQTIPAGLSVYGTPRPAPPYQIGERLPNIKIAGSSGKTELLHVLGDKSALIACLDPYSPPSVASIKVLENLKGTPVIVLNSNPKTHLAAGKIPVYHSASGDLLDAVRAPMAPLFYLVDGKGKVRNVWYGFDRGNPSKFADELSAAVANVHP